MSKNQPKLQPITIDDVINSKTILEFIGDVRLSFLEPITQQVYEMLPEGKDAVLRRTPDGFKIIIVEEAV
jgi:hypothetical protein